jgi:AraC-like DNA-binding protein
VLAAERGIIDAEVPYHVDGLYYAREANAAHQGRRAAERIVREAARRPSCEVDAAPVIPPAVATWLTPRERIQVDAAKPEAVRTRHRSDVRGLREDIETGEAAAAVVSAALVHTAEARELGALIRACPESPIVALVSDADEAQALSGALLLGRAGVDVLIDCRRPDGWQLLRNAMSAEHTSEGFMHDAVRIILSDLGADRGECSEGCARFFLTILEPRATSAKGIAARLGVVSSTLMSRFFRAGLPSPKRYATFARLVWAAHFADSTGASYRAIAYRLGASSSQSFGRTLRTFLGMTATEFRGAFTRRTMLDHFRAQLIAPYLDTLKRFDPLSEPSRQIGANVSRSVCSSGGGANVGRAA